MEKIENEIKCVVWDLDNTIWEGVLLESETVELKHGIREILKTLDYRGVLNSIASRNDYEEAIAKLKGFEIAQYFLYPEIHWNAKSTSIAAIQKNLNIAMNTILFVDDQQFELDEVKSVHPEINCLHTNSYREMLKKRCLNPKFATIDSRRRRQMYIDDLGRKKEEDKYHGPQDTFFKSLNMEFVISEATEEDLKRAEELTVRTNQLNATGKTYSYEELNRFRISDEYKLLICELTDKYGSYGKIGLSLIELQKEFWQLRLLLMSCRVMSRGVGTILLTYIMQEAKKAGRKLRADFRKTNKNKLMYVSYRFENFKEIKDDGEGNIVFENDLLKIQRFPQYIKVKVCNEWRS